ncbi:general stress protein [Hymenobacter lutimineralis]|uniref:General stress protein n=1 Tax=Hymenobacter lutimineralis TaxID=2606448 RepID=A0A5D6V617_9BACT|nr:MULTISPECIES: KGG domain-containing protein [Hymenobacter]QIX62909.1 general stress protein [Hymenobacter sp. BT18]TYZ10946.1 general stress protein [Hymenobacter lutimineralis]
MALTQGTQRGGAATAASGRKGTQSTAPETKKTSLRGFASMDPEMQRRIASEGGRASHLSGRGHQWTSEEARAAGRKGGQASRTQTNEEKGKTSTSRSR